MISEKILKMDNQKLSTPSQRWKTFLAVFVVIVGVAVAIILIVTLFLNFRHSFGPCSSNAACLSTQTCIQGTCLSLPGAHCDTNEQCATPYAPLCHPTEKYCTNFPKLPRGAAGNPPSINKTCDDGLILNTAVNICQQPNIGALCSVNAECHLGLCDSSRCQYAAVCNTDTALNPSQCEPGLVCESFRCSVPGIPPGGNGAPCTSNADCSSGNVCIPGPPGTTWEGVCRSGSLSWLTILQSSSDEKCIGPLTSSGTTWCRYDIASFMVCTSPGDCQYPYSECNTTLGGVCQFPAGMFDPIDTVGFIYTSVGVNSTNSVDGSFFVAAYPTTPPDVVNTTGGKLLDGYTGFLTPPQQFTSTFGSAQMSFSAISSFAVASLSTDIPTNYYTLLYDLSQNTALFNVWITSSSTQFNFQVFRQIKVEPSTSLLIPGTILRVWNPFAIRTNEPTINDVFFVQNPVVTPFEVPSGGFQSASHTLLWDEVTNNYIIIITLTYFDLADTQVTAVCSCTPTNIVTNKFIVTSWDAIGIPSAGLIPHLFSFMVFYGLDRTSGVFVLNILALEMTAVGTQLIINSPSLDVVPATIRFEFAVSETHVRLSKNLSPAIAVTFFTVTSSGLTISTFQLPNPPTLSDYNFDTNFACQGVKVLDNVNGLSFVTSVTSISGLQSGSCFVVRCATLVTKVAFLVIQVASGCVTGGSDGRQHFVGGDSFSAIYWRQLQGEGINYTLYPVGGAGLPFFLSIDGIGMGFDGTNL